VGSGSEGAGLVGAGLAGVVGVGSVVSRAVEGVAELLWPRGAGDRGEVVPLASARPLTVLGPQQGLSVPGVQGPAVQRVVFDHPGLASASTPSSRAVPAVQRNAVHGNAVRGDAAQVGAVRGAGAGADGQVLSWSADDQFHSAEVAEPAVQRVAVGEDSSVVRAVSLQQMFSAHASAPVVQREEAAADEDPPTSAPAPVQAPEPAPAPAAGAAPGAAAVGAAKAVSAAEVEELAKRLYEPLTAKLRAELWLDRERSGRVADRWR